MSHSSFLTVKSKDKTEDKYKIKTAKSVGSELRKVGNYILKAAANKSS